MCHWQWILIVPFEGQPSFPSGIPHREHPGTKIRASPRAGVPWILSGLTPQGSSREQLLVSRAPVLPCWFKVPWCFLKYPWLSVFPWIPSWSHPSLTDGFCLSAPVRWNNNNSAYLASWNHGHEFSKCFKRELKQFQEFLKLPVLFLAQSERLQTNFSSSVAGGLCWSLCLKDPDGFPWHFCLNICHVCVHPWAIKWKSLSLLST